MQVNKLTNVDLSNDSYSSFTIEADGENSVIDAQNLSSIKGYVYNSVSVSNNISSIILSNGGTLSSPVLASLSGVNLSLDDGVLVDSELTSFTSGQITILAGVYDFAVLSDIDGSGLSVSSGSVLSLPGIQNYTQIDSITANFNCTGAGSVLNLPNLTSFGSLVGYLFVSSSDGGVINLTDLKNINLANNSSSTFQLTSDGLNSVVNCPSLQSFIGNQTPTSIENPNAHYSTYTGMIASNEGLISSPALSVMKNLNVIYASGSITLAQGALLFSSNLSVRSGSYILNNLTNIDGTSINITGGSTLSLPNVTSVSYSSTSNAPDQLFSGASIEVTGTGSTLILPALQSITGEQALAIALFSAGSIEAPALTSATGVEVSLYSANIADFNALTTFTGGIFQLDGGVQYLSSLSNINDSSIEVSQGGVFTAPRVTSYLNSTANFIYLSSAGAGSVLSLPNLASIGSSNYAIPINAYSGGHTLLPGLKSIDLTNPSITDAVVVLSTGANSVVDLSGLVNFIGSNNDSTIPSVVNIFSSITYTNGGVVLDPNLTTIKNVNITTDPTAVLTIPAGQSVSYSINTGGVSTGSVNVQGSLNVQTGGYLGVLAPVSIANSGSLNVAPGGTIDFYGNLLGSPQSPSDFQPLGTVDLIESTASPASPQLLEAMSADLGAVPAGFVNNYAYGTLNLSSSSSVELVDQTHNTNTTTPEAVYANELIVPQGSTLNLNGIHLYVRGDQIAGTVVGGTVTIVPTTNAITPGTPAFGGLSIPGSVDSWTFTGTAGESIAAALNPGGGGPIPPFPPRLDFGQIELVDSSGTVIAKASSATAGSTALINGFTLPVTGTYTIDVQASTAAPASVGNYVLSVYNVTPVVAPLALNAPVSGTIDNPYAINQYVFNVSAGSHVQLQVLYRSSSDVTFNLNGPGGFVGFANLGSNSPVVELPVSGTYVLTAHGDGYYGGSYTVVLGYSSPLVARPAAVIAQHVKIARIEHARFEHARFLAYERLLRIEAYERLKAIVAFEHAHPHPRFGSFARSRSFAGGFVADGGSKNLTGVAVAQHKNAIKFLFLENERKRPSK